MNRPRLYADQMDPALVYFLLELSLATCVSESRYTAWLEANQTELVTEFIASSEPDPDEHQVENTFGIWARRKFLEGRVTA